MSAGSRHSAACAECVHAFGDLLRFWRVAFNISQEELADRARMSVRHLSFLENGRTRPSAGAVKNLVDSIGLKEREAAALFLAAGHSQAGDAGAREDDMDGADTPEDWIIILRHADPVPASIMDRFGHILAVNRAWVALHRLCLGRIAEGDALNALDLYLHPLGWRRFISHWSDVACVILTIMQQEAVLAHNGAALKNIRRWASTPGLPHDWPVIGARLSHESADYCYSIDIDAELTSAAKIVHAVLGYFPSDRNRTFILQSIYPQNKDVYELLRRACEHGADHSLCPY